MDVEVGVLQGERRIGRHATPGVGIAREQEIQPDRGVGVRSRLEILRIGFPAHSGEDDHHKHRAPAGREWRQAPWHTPRLVGAI